MNTFAKIARIFLGVVFSMALAAGAEMREFTDVKGRSLTAEFMGLLQDGEAVSLRLGSGELVAVPLERLSVEDRAFIKGHPLGKLKPVNLPPKPLHPVKEWSAQAKKHVVYFIDQDGKRAIRRPLTEIQGNGFADCLGLYAIVRGPQLGVIDTDGSAAFGVSAVGPDGLQAGSDVPVFIAREGEGESALYSYLNKEGKAFIRRKFAGARPFNSERAWVNLERADLPQGENNGLWTLIDYQGNLLHAFENLEVQDFSEGRAAVALDTRGREWSIIDPDAKVIAEGPFSRVFPFIDGTAVVDGRLMDREGKFLMEKNGEFYVENRHALSEGDAIVARRRLRDPDKTRYVILQRSTAEHLVDLPDHLYVEDGFFNGLAAVRDTKADKSGYINRLGQIIVDPQFARTERFRNGFAEVGVDNVHDLGVVNMSGKVIWKPQRIPEAAPPAEQPGEAAPAAPES